MSDVFVKDNQILDAKFYILSKKDSFKLYPPEDYFKISGKDKLDCEECHFFIKPLSWSRMCKIQSAANVVDPQTNSKIFDADEYLKIKLRNIIVSWNVRNVNIKGESVPVPVTPENIDALHISVANYILKQYTEHFENRD